ncbi:MAG TPA: prolyl oligopeptidase family serine peptidase [Bryobacteraceae bacterium]|nr:prolyl oligopeptidase family serine peptidase [Bryobacteraceae bacterium]
MTGKRIVGLLIAAAALAVAQTTAERVRAILQPPVHSAEVAAFQLHQYLLAKIPLLPAPEDAKDWTAQARLLRKRLLRDIVFHGWPVEWVNSPPHFIETGVIETGKGYRIRKLRYEVVPGFSSTALLYEPESVSGKLPAILNLNGHVGRAGKTVEYKQKRSINQALRGALALNLEWLGCGELDGPEQQHVFAGHLDLVGANGLGLFYLAMRRGLDYLARHAAVDMRRIGVTGLSGGGWQSILLGALDERVSVAVPVAGFMAMRSRLARPAEIGDNEQNATDLLTIADYSHLTALRAPRPTLLIYNAEDDCCFRAPLVKPHIFDPAIRFFRLYGQPDSLAWHENTDPSDHNYQLDNRQQAYRFFARYLGLGGPESEFPVDGEVRSFDELAVGLPPDNLSILGVARKLVERIERPLHRSQARKGIARADRALPAGSRNSGVRCRQHEEPRIGDSLLSPGLQ